MKRVIETRTNYSTTDYRAAPATIPQLAVDKLDGDAYEIGTMEAATQTAENNSMAIGRLLEILLESGVFSLTQVAGVLGLDEITMENSEDDV